MKMNNMLIGGMSLALVACISIGGTLAYLTSKDAQVTNTFTFGGNITVDLYEQILDQKGLIGEGDVEGTGVFGNIVADVDYKKDVDVKVEAKSDAYVFLRIKHEALNDDAVVMTLGDISEKWTPLDAGEIEDGYGIYYLKADADTYADGVVVPVFDTVRLESNEDGTVTVGETGEVAKIVLQVGAIQTVKEAGKEMTAQEAYDLATEEGVINWV